MSGQIDFGYPWWLSYGHLVLLGLTVCLGLLGYARRWSRVPMLLLAALAIWSTTAFLVARFALNINGRASLVTENFLASGTGRVLDLGAGTGRSSIMVLEARPRTTLVALDLFGASYVQHFGPGGDPQAKLMANLKAAGVEQRATIQAGDMRKLPFEPAGIPNRASTAATWESVNVFSSTGSYHCGFSVVGQASRLPSR